MYRSMLSFDQTTRSSFNAHPLMLAHLSEISNFLPKLSAANAESIRSNYSCTCTVYLRTKSCHCPLITHELKAQLASYSERCMLHVHSISPGRAIKPHSSCSKNIMPWQAGLKPVPWCFRARYCGRGWLATKVPAVAATLSCFLQRKPALAMAGFAHHPSISEALHDTL